MTDLNIPNGCRGIVGVCTVRFTLLGSDCAPQTGESTSYVVDAMANLSWTREYRTIAEIERTSCAGKKVAWSRPEQKRLKRLALEGSLELFDAQAHNFLFGTTALTAGSEAPESWAGKVIGAADEIGAADPPKVAMEIWQETVDPDAEICSAVEGAETYAHRVFPLVSLWEADSADLATDQGMAVTFTGFALANPSWGTGPHGDWLPAEDMPATSPHAWFWDPTVPPAATCGLSDISGS